MLLLLSLVIILLDKSIEILLKCKRQASWLIEGTYFSSLGIIFNLTKVLKSLREDNKVGIDIIVIIYNFKLNYLSLI